MKKKKVALLMRGLSRGGVYRALDQVLNAYAISDLPQQLELIAVTDDMEVHATAKKLGIQTFLTPKLPKIVWDYLYSYYLLHHLGVESVIYTKNIIPLTHFFSNWEKKLIVYDLAFMYPKLKAYKLFDSIYMKFFLGLSLKIASSIYPISGFTKQEISFFFRTQENKIKVMHLAVDPVFTDKSDNTSLSVNLADPFIFYCGSLSPRKNLVRTIQAFRRISQSVPHTFYIFSGSAWGDQEIQAELAKDKSQRIKVLPFVSNLELAKIYRAASLMVYPSLYEGFGLPIIEAQASGCPVLTSNTTSCVEILGEYPFSCNPYSVSDIADKMKQALTNQEAISKALDQGYSNVKRFSWLMTTQILFK